MSTPIGNLILYLSRIVEMIVASLSPNPGKSQVMIHALIVSTTIGIACLMVRFWWEVANHNSKARGDRIDGFIASLKFLGPKLLMLPLVGLGAILPQIISQVTPNAFIATGYLAVQVADIGDGILSKLSILNSRVADLKVKSVLDSTPLNIPGLSSEEMQALKELQQSFEISDSQYKSAKSNVDALGRDIDGLKTLNGDWVISGYNTANQLSTKSKELEAARVNFGENVSAVKDVYNSIMNQIKDAETTDDLMMLYRKLEALPGAKGNESNVYNGKYLEALNEVSNVVYQLKTGDQKSPSLKNLEVRQNSDSKKLDILSQLPYYSCLLPAIIGLLAGAMICMKHAVSLLQLGAKLEIMKNLSFLFATIFGPILMLGFLFQKTEQFAWKYLTLLFSIFFGFFALSYVVAVTVGPGFRYLEQSLPVLTMVSKVQLEQVAGMDTFINAAGMGLKGFGVGMVAGFLVDITRSAVSVGQSLLTGTFSAT